MMSRLHKRTSILALFFCAYGLFFGTGGTADSAPPLQGFTPLDNGMPAQTVKTLRFDLTRPEYQGARIDELFGTLHYYAKLRNRIQAGFSKISNASIHDQRIGFLKLEIRNGNSTQGVVIDENKIRQIFPQTMGKSEGFIYGPFDYQEKNAVYGMPIRFADIVGIEIEDTQKNRNWMANCCKKPLVGREASFDPAPYLASENGHGLNPWTQAQEPSLEESVSKAFGASTPPEIIHYLRQNAAGWMDFKAFLARAAAARSAGHPLEGHYYGLSWEKGLVPIVHQVSHIQFPRSTDEFGPGFFFEQKRNAELRDPRGAHGYANDYHKVLYEVTDHSPKPIYFFVPSSVTETRSPTSEEFKALIEEAQKRQPNRIGKVYFVFGAYDHTDSVQYGGWLRRGFTNEEMLERISRYYSNRFADCVAKAIE